MKAPSPEIPVFRPDITEAEIDAVVATLRSGWIGSGPRVAEFERRFAEFTGAAHAVSTATGTAALQTALVALGVGAGDEVIVPAFTWVSAFQAVVALGATPVFADIEPEYLTIAPQDVERLINARTKVIIAVHHGGQLADMDALAGIVRGRRLHLLDDAAHACGAAYRGQAVGTLGDVTCFSFNAMKNITTGDGGMITTADPEIARRASAYRSLGIDRDTYARYAQTTAGARWVYDVVSDGQRFHMNDIAAAIGLVQLQRLEHMNAHRGRLVSRYRAALADVAALRPVVPRPGTRPSHHMFTVRVPHRDSFVERMRERGISIGVHYIPIHLFSAAKPYHRPLPVTEQVWREVCTFPLFPAQSDAEADRVAAAAREVAVEL